MKAIFTSMPGDLKLEPFLLNLRRDFDEQINQIIRRIDGIENEIKKIKERLC
jgi:hypothetical protein